jgi:periplasmic protein TonB
MDVAAVTNDSCNGRGDCGTVEVSRMARSLPRTVPTIMFGDEHIWRQRSTHSNRVAVGSSLVTHAVLAALAVWVSTLPRSVVTSDSAPITRKYDLIWIDSPGPGGGGGGGGDKTPVPARAQEVGNDSLTVPTARAEPKPVEKPKELPTPLLEIPARPLADAIQSMAGVLDAAPPDATTQGPGAGGSAGAGTGTGSGEGRGSGLGPGFGGGTGGGAYRPGNGVTSPRLLREVKPNYTATAMRAKIQGVVLLECVVLPDGSVGSVTILKSLDKAFGLDEEAVKAARQWRFAPGQRLGEPVPVLVTIELGFTLR